LEQKTDTIIITNNKQQASSSSSSFNFKQHQRPNQKQNLLTTVSKLLKIIATGIFPRQNLGHFENPFGRESFGRSWVG
jgi:hypothetical protein